MHFHSLGFTSETNNLHIFRIQSFLHLVRVLAQKKCPSPSFWDPNKPLSATVHWALLKGDFWGFWLLWRRLHTQKFSYSSFPRNEVTFWEEVSSKDYSLPHSAWQEINEFSDSLPTEPTDFEFQSALHFPYLKGISEFHLDWCHRTSNISWRLSKLVSCNSSSLYGVLWLQSKWNLGMPFR